MKPMLAVTASISDIEAFLKHSPLICMPKFDGIRCLYTNQALSRTLKPIRNEYIQSVLRSEIITYFLDGELIVGENNKDTFGKTSSGVMSKDGEPDFIYNVFDAYKTDNVGALPYEKRLEHLGKETQHIKKVNYVIAKNITDVLSYEEQILNAGYEGLILRNPKSPYKEGRSTLKEFGMVKLKRFSDAEAVVIGFAEELENTNIAFTDELGHTKRASNQENLVGKNTLGGIIVRDLVHGWEFQIGTGFDAKLRKEIWIHQDKWLNQIIKYKYFEVGMKDLPRFPVYLGVRNKDDM